MALTEQMQLFADEFLIDLNRTQAAIRAGYSVDTAYSQGQRLLKHVEVASYVRERMAKRNDAIFLDACFVLDGLKEVADRCMQQVPVMVFDPINKCMVQAQDNDGNNVWQFDPHGANKAFELIGKHQGIFEKDNAQKAPPAAQVFNIGGQEISF